MDPQSSTSSPPPTQPVQPVVPPATEITPQPIPPKNESVTGLIISSILFFPFGLFYAWNKGKLSEVLPSVTVIISLINVISGLLTFAGISQIKTIYGTLGINTDHVFQATAEYMGVVIVLSVIAVVAGYLLKQKVKTGPKLTYMEIGALAVLMIIPVIVMLFYTNAIAAPILFAINHLGDGVEYNLNAPLQ